MDVADLEKCLQQATEAGARIKVGVGFGWCSPLCS
jgi:hypothetical protein